mgnify:CR=1 FL=1
MARPGITQEDVFKTIERIIALGEKPTINVIRSFLGTGSPNTIHRHLVEYRNYQKNVEVELPASLKTAIINEINNQSESVREKLSKIISEIETENNELAASTEKLEQELEQEKNEKKECDDKFVALSIEFKKSRK